MNSSVERYNLRPGYSISRVIKGGWQLAGDHGEVDRTTAVSDMLQFVDAGVTTFDCADIYTGVEVMIGEFIGRLRAERGEQALDAIKVHTKFVPDYDKLAKVDRGYVTDIIDRSLQRLRLPQLNLVQFHWWDYEVPGWIETIRHLDELRQQGKVDKIGVTNFDAEHIAEITDAGVELVSAQVQYSLLDQRPASDFTTLCQERQVSILCYGVLAGGFISEHWLGQSDPGYQFENRSLIKYRLMIDELGGWDLFQQLLTTLNGIAQNHGVNLSTVAMRTMLDKPQVGAIIIGARYAHYLPATLTVFDLVLTANDYSAIDDVLAQSVGSSGPVYGLERDREGRHGRIMKYNLNQ